MDWSSLTKWIIAANTAIGQSSSGSLVTPVFNVKTYGATGDGSTDDTLAIQRAMAALAVTGTTGGSLYFPSGTYKYSSTLQFGVLVAQKNVRITGDGVSSILKPTGSFSTNPTLEFRSSDYWSIAEIKIDGSARTGTGDLVLIDGSSNGVCEDCTVVNSTRYGVNVSKVNAAGQPTFNTVLRNTFSGNVTDNVFVGAGATGNVLYDRNGVPSGPNVVDVASQFGVKADGVTDATVAAQAALDYGKAQVDAGIPVCLVWPVGRTRVTSTLVMKGNGAMAPAMVGAIPRGDNYSVQATSVIWWDGATGGQLFFTEGVNSGFFRDLVFDGNSKAKTPFVWSATTFADRSVLAASNDIVFERVTLQKCQVGTVGAGCMEIGTDPSLTGGNTYEAATGTFRNCRFLGEDNGATGFSYAGMKAFGVRNMSGGNAKCFAFYDCNWQTCNKGLDNTNGSAQVVVENAQVADCRTAFEHSAGELRVTGFDCECGHVDDFRFLHGTGSSAVAIIQSGEAAGFMSGSTGTIIDFSGALTLTDVFFGNANSSVSGNPNITNPFVIKMNLEDTVGSSLTLERCSFDCCDTSFVPVINSTDSLKPIATNYGGENAFRLRSFGCWNKTTVDGTPAPLKNFDSGINTLFRSIHNGPLDLAVLSGANPSVSFAQNKTLAPVDATSGNKVFTLPTASTCPGRWYIVVKTDVSVNTVTVNSKVLSNQKDAALVFSDGTSWINPTFT